MISGYQVLDPNGEGVIGSGERQLDEIVGDEHVPLRSPRSPLNVYVTPLQLREYSQGDFVIFPEDFGAVGDGVTDDTDAIQAAIDFADEDGKGIIFFGPKTYLISATLEMEDVTGVKLMGCGQGHAGDTADTYKTRLLWAGAAHGTMLHFHTTQTATGIMNSSELTGFFLDCNSIADVALKITSLRLCRFTELTIKQPTLYGIWITCLADQLSGGGDPTDTQHCEFSNIYIRSLNSGTKAIWADGNAGSAATRGANTSFCIFNNIALNIRNGDGFVFGYSDANSLNLLQVFRPAPNTGIGLLFQGATGDDRYARYNQCFNVQPQLAGCTAKAGTQPSIHNVVVGYSLNNGGTYPVIEATADLQYTTDVLLARFPMSGGVFVETADAAGQAQALAQMALRTNETMRIHNNSSNNMRLLDSNGNEYAIAINNANGNLRFQRIGGSGVLQFGTFSAIGAEALAGYITISDGAGNTRKLAVIA